MTFLVGPLYCWSIYYSYSTKNNGIFWYFNSNELQGKISFGNEKVNIQDKIKDPENL